MGRKICIKAFKGKENIINFNLIKNIYIIYKYQHNFILTVQINKLIFTAGRDFNYFTKKVVSKIF